jgi:hypothetical protein
VRAAAIALLALAVVWPRVRLARWVMALVGGCLLVASVWDTRFSGRQVMWAAPVAVAVAVSVWWAGPRAHERLVLPGSWLVLLGCTGAVYVCVPETDHVREVAVVMAAGALAELLTRRRLPAAAVVAAGAFVEWAALFGAVGRGRAIVGGLFALAPLVAVAVVPAGGRWRSPAVAAVWLAAAAVMARTGGVAHSLPPAVVAAGVCAAGATLVTVVLVRLDRE